MKWFKHDGDAMHDPKLEKLIMKYGIEGYGLYFACVELIAGELSAEHPSFELEHDAELLAHKFHMDSRRVEAIMTACVELELFEYNPTRNRILCLTLLRRIDESMQKAIRSHPEILGILKKARDQGLLTADSGKVPETFRKDSGPDEIRLDKTIVEEEGEGKTPPRHHRGSKVLLSDSEYGSLCSRYTQEVADRYIEKINDYCVQHGQTYTDYNRTVHTWIKNDKVKGKLRMPAVSKSDECPECKIQVLGGVCHKCGWRK